MSELILAFAIMCQKGDDSLTKTYEQKRCTLKLTNCLIASDGDNKIYPVYDREVKRAENFRTCLQKSLERKK